MWLTLSLSSLMGLVAISLEMTLTAVNTSEFRNLSIGTYRGLLSLKSIKDPESLNAVNGRKKVIMSPPICNLMCGQYR